MKPLSLLSFLFCILLCLLLPSCGAIFSVDFESESGDAKAGLESDGKWLKLWGAKDDKLGREYKASTEIPVSATK